MSLDTAQTNVTELQDDVAQAAAELPNFKTVTEEALNFPVLSGARSAWLPTHVTEQAFQSFRRILEANFAATQAFCDMVQRQQDFFLTTTQAALAGLPGATARHVGSASASVREAYGQNLRMLGMCTSAMLKRPSQTAVGPQNPATS
jgi:hypothetical protein